MPFENTNAGVPQGSVLGSLLFLIHVYDIAGNLISLTRLCADETSLSYSRTSPNTIANVLNSDLEQILAWSKDWVIDFNRNKTITMTLRTLSVTRRS